jgi:hypothetical protein
MDGRTDALYVQYINTYVEYEVHSFAWLLTVNICICTFPSFSSYIILDVNNNKNAIFLF